MGKTTKRAGVPLGSATMAAPTAPAPSGGNGQSQARAIWREAWRDLLSRKAGLLMARDYLDAAADDAQHVQYGSVHDGAQVVAALLAVRDHVDAEMERVDAQMTLVDMRMRAAAATPAA